MAGDTRIWRTNASTAASYNPSRDDFAAMLDESFAGGNLQESSVIKGIVVAIEKDMASSTSASNRGRVALREFNGPGREADLKVGDEVEVFLDRIENALGEAVLSRDKARREESWGKLEKLSTITRRFTASSSIRSRAVLPSISTARWPSCALAGRHSSDSRRRTADEQFAAVPDPQDGSPPRTSWCRRRTVLEETAPSSARNWCKPRRGQVIDGVVKNITDYGAFVDLGGIDGLLHVTDIAWRRVNHPTEVLTIGKR